MFSLPCEHSKEKLNAVHVKINLQRNNLNFSILKKMFCIENYKYGKNTLNEVQIQIQVKMIRWFLIAVESRNLYLNHLSISH